jgi:predicted RNase H-like HicB family nuclease
MLNNYFIDVVINKEKLNDGSIVFVAHCMSLRITSQGSTMEEAMVNIKEASELYLEEEPEKYEELRMEGPPMFSVIEVKRNAKTTNPVR